MPTSDPKCPFCKIVAGKDREVREVLRTEGVVAFFPLEPATLGHTLVVPERHIVDIWSLDEQTASRISAATLRVASAVRRAIAPEGLNIIQSNGEAAAQTVPHLHVHVVPRWHGDRIGRIWPPETAYSESQKDEAWGKLRTELKGGSEV
jgi:histidine triad (HIT) family protein